MIRALRLRWHAFVTRLLSSQRFANTALGFWPTRLVARRQARELFDLVSGFVYSQILYAAVKTGLLPMLKTPMTLNHISEQLGFDEAHCRRLLRATTTLKLTRALPDHHYGLGSHGAALLANPGLLQLIEHHQMFYQDLADPIALFTGSAPNSASVNDAGGNKNTGGSNSLGSGRIEDASSHLGTYWAYAGNADPTIRDASAADQVADYSALMAASQPMVSAQVLHCYSFSNHVRLLDLGGGTGRFLSAVGRRYPTLKLSLFDLPAVHSLTDSAVLKEQNIERHQGDFFTDPLPADADIVSLVRILHDHNDDAVLHLLRKVYEILPDQGTILIAEPLAETPGAARVGDAYFNLYFLAMGKGEPRSAKRLQTLLIEAGFSTVKLHRTHLPLVCSVMTASVSK